MATFEPTNLVPSTRSYSPGEYPQNEFQALNGVKTIIRYGKYRYNSTLTLGFNNIEDSDAAAILQNYEDINSVWDEVTFNGTGVVEGASSQMQSYFVERTELKWRYDGPPMVTSVYPGRSNVECKFVACLDSP
mgnify:CR=1 FL=1|tara:strand:+ start:5457 stop:5855 length:399 start_codon:yes stop_codon:yes gene_type:complete